MIYYIITWISNAMNINDMIRFKDFVLNIHISVDQFNEVI